MNSIEYALVMKKHHIPCELHIYEHGGHGYGLGKEIQELSHHGQKPVKNGWK